MGPQAPAVEISKRQGAREDDSMNNDSAIGDEWMRGMLGGGSPSTAPAGDADRRDALLTTFNGMDGDQAAEAQRVAGIAIKHGLGNAAICNLLQDVNPAFSTIAADVLGDVGPESARPSDPLEAALRDLDQQTRTAVGY
jgi:hypothetical protein